MYARVTCRGNFRCDTSNANAKRKQQFFFAHNWEEGLSHFDLSLSCKRHKPLYRAIAFFYRLCRQYLVFLILNSVWNKTEIVQTISFLRVLQCVEYLENHLVVFYSYLISSIWSMGSTITRCVRFGWRLHKSRFIKSLQCDATELVFDCYQNTCQMFITKISNLNLQGI